MTQSMLISAPYLKKDSRPYRYAKAIFDGYPIAVAYKMAGYEKRNSATAVFARLRRSTEAYVGREVNDVFALRMIFDRDRLEHELKLMEDDQRKHALLTAEK